MKKRQLAVLLATGLVILFACEKTPPKIEEPKVENCLECIYLLKGCLGDPYFSLVDTTKFKGLEYTNNEIFSNYMLGTQIAIMKIPPPYRVISGNYWLEGKLRVLKDSVLQEVKFTQGKKYFFEYRSPRKTDNWGGGVDGRRCYLMPWSKEFVVILDTLTSKCTKYK